MTVPELLAKADPHNLETARGRVSRTTNRDCAAAVHASSDKFVLLLNDKVLDGHHHLARAEKGKVTRSLPVLDLTPLRYQSATVKGWATINGAHVLIDDADSPHADGERRATAANSPRDAAEGESPEHPLKTPTGHGGLPHIVVHGAGEHVAHVQHGLAVLEEVLAHDDRLFSAPLPLRIATQDVSSSDRGVHIRHAFRNVGLRIGVHPRFGDKAWTTVHEGMHELDTRLGSGPDYASHGERGKKVMAAIRTGKASAKLNREIALLRGKPKKNPLQRAALAHYNYLNRPHERFARALTHYVAWKTQDPHLLSALARQRAGIDGPLMYHADEEFAATVAPAITRFLTENKLAKSPSEK